MASCTLLVLVDAIALPRRPHAMQSIVVCAENPIRIYRMIVRIIQPETLVRWHRAGFVVLALEVIGTGRAAADRDGIARADPADEHREPTWGAPRIHGELLKLGLAVAQSSVAKYMVKRRGPPSQGWCTFLHNHAPGIAAMDLFVVPTIGFKLLYAFVIVRLNRGDLVWINVTTNPNAEWTTRPGNFTGVLARLSTGTAALDSRVALERPAISPLISMLKDRRKGVPMAARSCRRSFPDRGKMDGVLPNAS
jgi:hypothetical protein